jgi:hypothetical protein
LEGSVSALAAKPNWTTTKRGTGGAKIEVLTDLKKKFPEGGNADA